MTEPQIQVPEDLQPLYRAAQVAKEANYAQTHQRNYIQLIERISRLEAELREAQATIAGLERRALIAEGAIALCSSVGEWHWAESEKLLLSQGTIQPAQGGE